MAIETGLVVYQPALQAAVLQVTELVGAAASNCAVKLVPLLELPGVVLGRDRSRSALPPSC